MGSHPMGPGTVLGGRYRLDDLLTDHDGARFWRGTDKVLARSVAVHALASTDERAPGVLEAARLSATVTDPHFLRVLDCDDDGRLAWVINEWGSGQSLDLMLQRGALPPTRAAWLAREVAEAMAAAHAESVHHGRLNPEAVLVTEAGAVKVIGFVTNRAFEGPSPAPEPYGELDLRERDVIDLAGILYAGLTGRWPGVSTSAVPPAPREGGHPLRPRQVRAGIPRTLDTICDRVLNKEASQHSMPIETAQEIAAALSDYVGDPSTAAPLDVPSMHAEPTVAIPRAALADLQAAGKRATDPDATIASPGSGASTRAGAQPPVEPPDPSPQGPSGGAASRSAGTGSGTAETPVPSTPRGAPEGDDGPPPFDDLPERPLFADHQRRVPRDAPVLPPYPPGGGNRSGGPEGDPENGPENGPEGGSGTGTDLRTSTGTGAGGSAAYWPFEESPDDTGSFSGREGRGWLRLAAIVAVVIALLAAMFFAFNYGRGDEEPPATRNAPAEGDTTSTVGEPVPIVAANDFDPQGNPTTENPELVPLAIDGKPGTAWRTLTYEGNPELGGLKDGVGLVLDLGADRTVGSVALNMVGQPTRIGLYATPAGVNDPPTSLEGFEPVAEPVSASENQVIRPEEKVRTRFLLVWMTRLPAVEGGFRGEIAEVKVHS